VAPYSRRSLAQSRTKLLPDAWIQAPTKYELVITKTAKALGLTVPETLLARARGDRMSSRREFITLLGGAVRRMGQKETAIIAARHLLRHW